MNTVLDAQHEVTAIADRPRVDSDYVFHELTRSICPIRRRVIDAKILLRDNHEQALPPVRPIMALIYADAGHDPAGLWRQNRTRLPT